MARQLSGDEQFKRIGISSFSEGKTSLEVIGNASVDGNLGIGSTNPGSNQLLVQGDSEFTEDVIIGENILTAGVSTGLLLRSIGQFVSQRSGSKAPVYSSYDGELSTANLNIQFWNDGSAFFLGNVGLGTDNPTSDLQVGSASSSFNVVSTESSVQVGIGTTAPEFTLEVVGDTNIEGELTIDGSQVGTIAYIIALGGF